jgi:osmotically inducible protein OsmC
MHVPDDIARTAAVKWQGDVAKGHGTITTGSGKVSADYSFGTRFTSEPGTNPEELLAASHAACFTMALSASLTRAGHPPHSIDTTAKVHLQKSGAGFDIPRIELTTNATVPGITDNEFQQLANQSKESCPISKALHAVPMTLIATLHTTV